jgi:CBS domain-containing protein
MAKVKDIMRKYVVTVEPGISLASVAKIMFNNKVGSAVIIKKKKPVGIVTSEDIVSVVARGKSPSEVKAGDLAGREFITASPDDDVLRVVKKMARKGVKRIPVVKGGRLQGILTDKEILLTTPEMIDVLSEKLKARVERVASPNDIISGICETCEGYSDELNSVGGRWLCESCRG